MYFFHCVVVTDISREVSTHRISHSNNFLCCIVTPEIERYGHGKFHLSCVTTRHGSFGGTSSVGLKPTSIVRHG
jgi:hypothetical protein